MEPKQAIVPVRLDQPEQQHGDSSESKAKVAFQLTDSTKHITVQVYNGIDKYILYTLLKGLSE